MQLRKPSFWFDHENQCPLGFIYHNPLSAKAHVGQDYVNDPAKLGMIGIYFADVDPLGVWLVGRGAEVLIAP